MHAHTIKKAIGLFVVYTLIIIGIFVLQFSAESIITEKIGALQISLSRAADETSDVALKNELSLTFNGITISCDDSNPAFIVYKDSLMKEPIKLIDWEKQDNLSYKLIFTNDVSFNVGLSDETEKGGLSLSAVLPEDVEDFYLPYSISSSNEVSGRTSSRMLVGSKKNAWEFIAPDLQEHFIHFTSSMPVALYTYYEETVEFKFTVLADASVSTDYAHAVSSFRDNIISSFKANTSEALSNEQSVVAYVAEQASRGNYISAIDEIPQSFKRGENRTYLSAPYFNTLSDMNDNLEADLKEKESLIRRASSSDSLSLFTVRDITSHLYIYPNSLTVKKILEDAGEANIQDCSLAECAGILRTYVEMNGLSKAFASHLEPVLPECVSRIEKACKIEGVNLTISENGTFLSVVQAIEIGDALLRYGQYVGDASVITGGKALIASYLGESGSFDIRTLSDLYPVVVRNNTYYPHFVKLMISNDDVVWAWTVARNISAETAADRSVTYTIDFPLEHTHHIIIRGVPSFRGIYIYDMSYRTDPRFETYNSSGYVYKTDTKALLLKSRHKAEVETVRLTYRTETLVVETPVEIATPVESEGTPSENSSDLAPSASGEEGTTTENTASNTGIPPYAR